ncbi:MAG: BrnT family toxin [Synergistaceae bacterium]|nr:BrnT family toxin [Synergistaceae bacterium]
MYLTVVYCDRGEDIRIISARRATKFEIAAYNNTLGRY